MMILVQISSRAQDELELDFNWDSNLVWMSSELMAEGVDELLFPWGVHHLVEECSRLGPQ